MYLRPGVPLSRLTRSQADNGRATLGLLIRSAHSILTEGILTFCSAGSAIFNGRFFKSLLLLFLVLTT